MALVTNESNYDEKQTKKFFNVCKKCESQADEEIISKLEVIISNCENGYDSIDINYQHPRNDEFALKYIVRYLKPTVLRYIMHNFNNRINWMIIDNPKLNNNILHYLIADLNTNSKDEMKSAVEIINMICKVTSIEDVYNQTEKNEKNETNNTNSTNNNDTIETVETQENKEDTKEEETKEEETDAPPKKQVIKLREVVTYGSNWEQLLYQKNEYSYTPMEYAQKRNMFDLGKELEAKLFSHVSELLIRQCGIPPEIALVIVQYMFEFYHLWAFSNKLFDVLNK